MSSASCCFSMFFTSYEINIKRSPNATKLHDDFLWAIRKAMGPGCTWGVPRGGHNPPGRAWPPGVPRWVVPPSGHPSGTSLAHPSCFGPKKSAKTFVAFGLRLVLIFCEVKDKQKTATSTGHHVNRLVPKNDRKLL